MMTRLVLLACLLAASTAYSIPNKPAIKLSMPKAFPTAATVVGLAISVVLATAEPASASSKTAAQINLGSLPPSTISVQIQDLPVVGNLLSGTYAKVDSIQGQPSVVIKSPTDKIAAVKSIVTAGHLEFDVAGLINTHLDVDVGADEAGVAKIRVASNLIPPLPFKNAAVMTAPPSGKPTPWNVVTNMGTGESYYYNEVTGVSQNEKPQV